MKQGTQKTIWMLASVGVLLAAGAVFAAGPKEKSHKKDTVSIPGMEVDQGRPLTAEEAALLEEQSRTEDQDPDALNQMWQQKGYGRPAKEGEKEKASQTVSRDAEIQETLRKIREGSY